MAFGQSKYYVDSLSENTKRGLRQKLEMENIQRLLLLVINDSRIKVLWLIKEKSYQASV